MSLHYITLHYLLPCLYITSNFCWLTFCLFLSGHFKYICTVLSLSRGLITKYSSSAVNLHCLSSGSFIGCVYSHIHHHQLDFGLCGSCVKVFKRFWRDLEMEPSKHCWQTDWQDWFRFLTFLKVMLKYFIITSLILIFQLHSLLFN